MQPVLSSMTLFPHGLFIAMASGLFGASFFMLIELQRNLGLGGTADLRDMWAWRFLMLRCVVGVGAASILYFFFRSGLISGNLWPNVQKMTMEAIAADAKVIKNQRIVPNQDFALLVVWSFIAGYSQTLVPGLLLKTEGRAADTK